MHRLVAPIIRWGRSMNVSHVHAEAEAACAFSVAQEYTEDYLRRAVRGGSEASVQVPIVGNWAVGPTAQFAFTLRSDSAEPGRLHEEIELHWTTASRLLPDFQGTLRFRAQRSETRIALDGTYLVPAGAVGRFFNVLVGRRIAARTCQHFVRRIADRLAERERSWRADAS